MTDPDWEVGPPMPEGLLENEIDEDIDVEMNIGQLGIKGKEEMEHETGTSEIENKSKMEPFRSKRQRSNETRELPNEMGEDRPAARSKGDRLDHIRNDTTYRDEKGRSKGGKHRSLHMDCSSKGYSLSTSAKGDYGQASKSNANSESRVQSSQSCSTSRDPSLSSKPGPADTTSRLTPTTEDLPPPAGPFMKEDAIPLSENASPGYVYPNRNAKSLKKNRHKIPTFLSSFTPVEMRVSAEETYETYWGFNVENAIDYQIFWDRFFDYGIATQGTWSLPKIHHITCLHSRDRGSKNIERSQSIDVSATMDAAATNPMDNYNSDSDRRRQRANSGFNPSSPSSPFSSPDDASDEECRSQFPKGKDGKTKGGKSSGMKGRKSSNNLQNATKNGGRVGKKANSQDKAHVRGSNHSKGSKNRSESQDGKKGNGDGKNDRNERHRDKDRIDWHKDRNNWYSSDWKGYGGEWNVSKESNFDATMRLINIISGKSNIPLLNRSTEHCTTPASHQRSETPIGRPSNSRRDSTVSSNHGLPAESNFDATMRIIQEYRLQQGLSSIFDGRQNRVFDDQQNRGFNDQQNRGLNNQQKSDCDDFSGRNSDVDRNSSVKGKGFGSGKYNTAFGSGKYNTAFGSGKYNTGFGSGKYGESFGSGKYGDSFDGRKREGATSGGNQTVHTEGISSTAISGSGKGHITEEKINTRMEGAHRAEDSIQSTNVVDMEEVHRVEDSIQSTNVVHMEGAHRAEDSIQSADLLYMEGIHRVEDSIQSTNVVHMEGVHRAEDSIQSADLLYMEGIHRTDDPMASGDTDPTGNIAHTSTNPMNPMLSSFLRAFIGLEFELRIIGCVQSAIKNQHLFLLLVDSESIPSMVRNLRKDTFSTGGSSPFSENSPNSSSKPNLSSKRDISPLKTGTVTRGVGDESPRKAISIRNFHITLGWIEPARPRDSNRVIRKLQRISHYAKTGSDVVSATKASSVSSIRSDVVSSTNGNDASSTNGNGVSSFQPDGVSSNQDKGVAPKTSGMKSEILKSEICPAIEYSKTVSGDFTKMTYGWDSLQNQLIHHQFYSPVYLRGRFERFG